MAGADVTESVSQLTLIVYIGVEGQTKRLVFSCPIFQHTIVYYKLKWCVVELTELAAGLNSHADMLTTDGGAV